MGSLLFGVLNPSVGLSGVRLLNLELPRMHWFIHQVLMVCRREMATHSSTLARKIPRTEDPGRLQSMGSHSGAWLSDYTFMICRAPLVAQTVKNPPAMWETWAQSLGWEDPLEEGMATHSSILAWGIPTDRGACWAAVHGVAKSWTRPSD